MSETAAEAAAEVENIAGLVGVEGLDPAEHEVGEEEPAAILGRERGVAGTKARPVTELVG